MAFSWNYNNDIENLACNNIIRTNSTKRGISSIFSMGLLGLSHGDNTRRRELAKNLKLLIRLLKFSGLYVEYTKTYTFSFYMAIIRIFIIVGLATYKILFTFGYLVLNDFDDKNPHISAGIIVVLSWMFKSWFAMVFLIYWQYKGYISELLHEMNKYKNYCNSKKARRYMLKMCIIPLLMFLGILNGAVVHSILAHTGYSDRAMLDKRAQELIFYFWFSPYLSILVSLAAYLIWLTIIAFYVISLNMISGEFEFFNDTLKNSLEKASSSKIDMENILLENFSTYLKMTDIIVKANNIFEVYTFVMVGLNIPTSMFVIISFLVGIKASWESVMFSIPILCFSIIELIGLTAIPAKVHATIHKIHRILYGIPQLWNPYNEKTYHIVTVFIDHINRNDLGISLWGFAIVTKPLILTTLSLIVTYLTILLQMNGHNY